MNGRRMVGRGVDNRFGCLLLIQLARQFAATPPRFPITLSWSTQEEIGFAGAKALAHSGAWDVVIAVDVFPAADGFGASGPLARVKLGGGPVARLVDHGAISSPVLARWVLESAAAAGLPLQMAPTGGETDGKILQAAGNPMVALSIPIRYLHSQAEMIDLGDLAHLSRLLTELVRSTPPVC
jgi:putative aminopeptidase FrvX